MTTFHISEDGNPRPCSAEPGRCPVNGGDTEHFPTKDGARAHYEESQGDIFATTPKGTTQQSRLASVPAVKGVSYEIDPYGEDVSEDGVPYTSVDAYRDKKNGERTQIATVTVYDDGMALVLNHGDSDIPNIKARQKLAEALHTKFVISPISAEEYRTSPKDEKQAIKVDPYGFDTADKSIDQIALIPGSEMTKEEIQKYSFSTISHNLSPLIGQIRLAATDKNNPEGSVAEARTRGENNINTAVRDIADKIDGDPKAVSKFVRDSITKKMTPIFDRYAKDPYKYDDPGQTFRELSDEIAKYSKKK